MHTVHHTKAVILRSSPRREADKTYWLFTEEFGLVVAVATGVRKAGAKLAGQLTEYSFIEVDLVKGKDVWRLISATSLIQPLTGNTTHPLARSYVRMLGVLDRFVIDEGAQLELFTHIQEVGRMIGGTYEDAKRFDTLGIWRMLVMLGYSALDEETEVLSKLPFLEALALLDDAKTTYLISLVNTAIKETQL